MITKIEVDGFKTFSQFQLELDPVQVIVGVNGAGKSNLFDVFMLLSHLADADLRTAFQQLRGDAGELFTIYPNGQRAERMSLALEMLVEPLVEDDWNNVEEIKYTRLRYELTISRQLDGRGLDRLYVEQESLMLIPRGEDSWIKRHRLPSPSRWLPKLTGGRAPFISTEEQRGKPTMSLHQDGRSGRKITFAGPLERTLLSSISNTEFPHAFAARQEMRQWHLLQLNPTILRQPSSMVAPEFMQADGQYLPGMLARLVAEDPHLLKDISRDLANLVVGITQIELEADATRDEYIIWAHMQDGRRFSSRVLSDGTLRMLALTAIKHDPEHRGVILFEEPENGVHPQQLEKIATLLSDLATNFNDPLAQDLPLRQFLCNTHSPVFIKQPPIRSHIVFASTGLRTQLGGNGLAQQITRMVRVYQYQEQINWEFEPLAEQKYTLAQVEAFLQSADTAEVQQWLTARDQKTNGHQP